MKIETIFICSISCMAKPEGDECWKLHGKVIEKENYPPLYEGCMCYIIGRKKKKRGEA